MSSIKKSSLTLTILLGSFLTVSKVHADIITTSAIVPDTPFFVDLLIAAGVAIAIVSVIAWLIIRVIRKRNVTRQ